MSEDADSPQEARWAAARLLGNTTMAREESRAMWIPIRLQQFSQDARYGLRVLRRSPGFAGAAVFMLTIGIGMIAGGYTVFNGLFVRGWVVPGNAKVFTAHAQRAEAPDSGSVLDGFSLGAVEHALKSAKAADYVAFKIDYFRVRTAPGDARGAHTAGVLASDNLINAIGVPLQAGASTLPGVDHAIVISDRIWRQLFAEDPNIVGRAAWLGDVPVTIAGVTSASFEGLGPTRLDVIVPFSLGRALGRNSSGNVAVDKTACCVSVAGRLRNGYLRPQAEAELNLLTSNYRRQVAQPELNVRLAATAPFADLRNSARGRSTAVVLALIGAGLLLVFLLTCANVGHLYLARSLQRRREIMVRLSLGATRGRVIRQLLTEGLVLSSLAGAAAFGLTLVVPPLMHAIEDNFTASMLASDWRVGLVSAATVMVASLAVSLAPAFQATRATSRLAVPVAGRGRGVILGTQIAIAAVLVLSATLITRGIIHASMAPSDFELHTTSILKIDTRSGRLLSKEQARAVRGALTAAIKSSGVRAGVIEVRTRSGRLGVADSFVSHPGSEVQFDAQVAPISAEAMDVLGVPLLSGRWPSADPAVLQTAVNETLARRLWPDQDPIGQTIAIDFFHGAAYQVVGLARDAHFAGFGDVEATVIVAPTQLNSLPTLVIRSEAGVIEQISGIMSATDPDLAVSTKSLRNLMTETLQTAQLGAVVAGALGTVALLLAVVGVFGVFSYLVEERRREIGIRLALGASRRQVRQALFAAGRGAIVGGLIGGLVLSAIAGLALRSYLFGLSPADPVSYLVVAAILALAALAAAAIPLRRALRVDPAVTLRAD